MEGYFLMWSCYNDLTLGHSLSNCYDYTKDEEDELSFLEGDEIIKLSEPSDEGKYF